MRSTAEPHYSRIRIPPSHMSSPSAVCSRHGIVERSAALTKLRINDRQQNQILTVGGEIDERIEREISVLCEALPAAESRESAQVTAVSVDSAWLKHCAPRIPRGRHVNIIAGRLTLVDGSTKLYAYVGNQVPSAASRLDHFLSKQGVQPHERVTVISDGAGEFTKEVDGSRFARGPPESLQSPTVTQGELPQGSS